LRTLLQESSEDQKELGEMALDNIRTLLKPLLDLIAQESQTSDQRQWIQSLNDRLDELSTDLFPRLDLNRYALTPQEIRVARLIRNGARSKAIAAQLGVSVRTIDIYRGRLRAKLGLRGQPRNLRTALQAIPDD
jgi:DNA-binding CsgD family transcriptional regulator